MIHLGHRLMKSAQNMGHKLGQATHMIGHKYIPIVNNGINTAMTVVNTAQKLENLLTRRR